MNDDSETAGVVTSAQEPSTSAVVFDGRRGELAGLLVWNLLLTLATFGIYRFWAKTRVRGFVWRHVKLLGEPLEYLGTGTELLIGFLIVVAILGPFASAYSLLPIYIPEGIPYAARAMQVLYYTLLAFLVQVAVHRARRYRLTRTAWRGVRFGLDGSALVYAAIWCLYALVTLATLGLAYPWLRVAATRYFARHARFGTTAVSFDARAWRLFPLWLVAVTPALAAACLFVAMNWAAFVAAGAVWNDLVENPDLEAYAKLARMLAGVDYRAGWLLVPSVVLLTWYRVNQFRYLVSAVRVGEVRLDSRLPTRTVYGVQVGFYLATLAVFVFLLQIAALLVQVAGEMWALIGILCLMVLAYLLYGLSRVLFLDVTLLKRACATLLLERPEALERTVQSTAAVPGRGEGLADALDVGGF